MDVIDFENAMGAVIIFIIVTSAIPNILIIVALSRNYHQRKYRDYVLLSACSCDLIRMLISGSLIANGLLKHRFESSYEICVLEACSIRFFEFSSICHIIVLALDRYLCSMKQKYALELYLRKSYVPLSLCSIYLYAFAWALLPVLGLGKYGLQGGNVKCGLISSEDGYSKIYMGLVLLLMYLFPTAFATFVAAKIIKRVKSNKISCTSKTSRVTAISGEFAFVTEDKEQSFLVLATTITFVITWLPYDLSLTGEIFSESTANEYVEVTTTVIGQFSALIMPLVYLIFYKDLRRTVKKMTLNN